MVQGEDGDPQHAGWVPWDRDGEAWRGNAHLERWPEELAGPEYWAYRVREEVERVVSDLVGERTARER
jgi:hypothetical protein